MIETKQQYKVYSKNDEKGNPLTFAFLDKNNMELEFNSKSSAYRYLNIFKACEVLK